MNFVAILIGAVTLLLLFVEIVIKVTLRRYHRGGEKMSPENRYKLQNEMRKQQL